MKFRIWVGKRESDILTYDYFNISITFRGSNQNNNFAFCKTERIKDNYGNEFLQYVKELLLQQVLKNKDKHIEIHFYNNSFAYKLSKQEPSLKKYIININQQQIFDIVRHKTLSRLWLQNTTDVPPFTYLSKEECSYSELVKCFPAFDKFIIQKSISGGGNGTYLMKKNNWEEIFHILNDGDIFLVSPYYSENISLSCHLIIDNENVTVFPISKQLLNYNNNKISYCANEYIEKNTPISINSKKAAINIGHRLLKSGYRGICGLDFIFANNKIMLIEINPRYQGSSYLINAELKNADMPSLFELNTMAFNDSISADIKNKIQKIQFSLQTKTIFCNNDFSAQKLFYPPNAIVFLDGLQNANIYEKGVYMYRYLEKTSSSDNSM